jgi:hypothetical protein
MRHSFTEQKSLAQSVGQVLMGYAIDPIPGLLNELHT